jgi:Uma2 family endonuclease
MTIAASVAPSLRRLTIDEFEQDFDGRGFELDDGLLVEMNVGLESAWIAGEIFARIRDVVRQKNLGWVFPPESGFKCFPEDAQAVRKPDVAFVRFGRFPDGQIPTGFSNAAPDLVVEVVSPGDRAVELERKLEQYQQAAIGLIWVIYPNTRSARIFRSQGTLSQVGADGYLDGEDVLPGFRVRLGELWPPSDQTATHSDSARPAR